MITKIFKITKQREIISIVYSEDVIKLRTISTTKYCKIVNGEFIKINTIEHFKDNFTPDAEFQKSVYYLTMVN
jgi:hypothetical protein